MTTATRVPVTVDYDGAELDAEDAWHTIRRHGAAHPLGQSIVRFRCGDGFTNSRALALQIALAVVPYLLALTGLAADLDDGRAADVVAGTAEQLTPGGGDTEAVGIALRAGGGDESSKAGELALGFGLIFSLVSMTTAMAQVERGSNRIYGIPRDRPSLHKYGRAAVMMAVRPLAGVMALLLWCYLSSIALFFGTALAAQLDAVRAGLVEPIEPDPGATETAELSSDRS